MADESAIRVEQDESGFARLVIRQDSGEEASVLIAYERLGYVAVSLLNAAHLAQRRTRQPLPALTEYPTIIPTTIGLGQAHLQDHEAVLVRFGFAALALAIPTIALRELGQALIAIGAKGREH